MYIVLTSVPIVHHHDNGTVESYDEELVLGPFNNGNDALHYAVNERASKQKFSIHLVLKPVRGTQ